MGRRKRVSKRFLIGLDETRANTLQGMANALGLTYSKVVAYLMDHYQLGSDKNS